MKSASTRVLLIEHESDYAALLRAELAGTTAPFEVGSAPSLAAGIDELRQTAFDAVVLDLDLPDSRGIDTVARLHAAAPELALVVLSGPDAGTTMYDALCQGAQEYLAREPSPPESLPRAILHAIERKRVDLAFRQSAARWQALFRHNPIETIVVDRDGRVTDYNDAKRTSGDRLPSVGDRMYVDYAAGHETDMRADLMQCIETGKIREFPEREYGDKVLSIKIAPFPSENPHGAVIASQDITERKRWERKLREAEAELAHTIEVVPGIIATANAHTGRFTHCNPASSSILGFSSEEFLSRPFIEFVHPDDRQSTIDEVERQLKGGSVARFENRYICKDGSYRWLEWRATAADEKGVVYAAATDITERLALEVHVRQSQKLESIGTLAGGVAHEINNPINGIMNYAQLILNRLGPDSPVSEFATEIGNEARRVAAIVRNLLSFSRPARERQSPARMCDIVATTLSLISAVIRHDQIALEVDVPEDLPQIKCRSQQIQQAVMNLLTNARDALNQKYAGHDENKLIRVSAAVLEKDGKRWIRTTVEDHGPGIPKPAREHLFEPFYTSKRPGKGTGLGLSISYAIVKEHGGELSLASKVGEWTRFDLDLPIEPGRRQG